ncbi:MarR family winged helix-turn-helix transcriptional regulator [Streptomyces sp. NPDC002018]|uniref:MarR family winged helix-turn-helix transcriptional regulator n=1 Tax=Streptomyces sp. NPDC002018 TaxID=3364629 RepID=UPI0036B75E9B
MSEQDRLDEEDAYDYQDHAHRERDRPDGPGDRRRRPTSAQELLSGTARSVFRLNGQFLAVSEELARPSGLAADWWQVLGAVLHEPLPVAGIARSTGLIPRDVRRIAELLVEKSLAAYEPDPAHSRAELLRPTGEGLTAIRRTGPGHAELAARLTAELGEEGLAETVRLLERLSTALDAIGPRP